MYYDDSKIDEAYSTGIFHCRLCGEVVKLDYPQDYEATYTCEACGYDETLINEPNYKSYGEIEEGDFDYDPRLDDDDDDRVPSGCSACGGPYPHCKDSCNLFDN